MWPFILILILSYLIGSFPTAILTGKMLRKMDIRNYGSGNAGATNVFRVLGWRAGVSVLLIDMFKGFVPVFWIAPRFAPQSDWIIYVQILAAVGAIAGHMWTLFAGFKGGKGVGTSAGVFLALATLPIAIALVSFVIVVALTRYVSLGSLLAAVIFIAVMALQKFVFHIDVPNVLFYLSVAVVLLIWIAHKSNIQRLISGSENKLSFGKSVEGE
ncbi:MAG: glycerol-3-phosphate 1-O-acyltransferase PlsY [Caldithrix sp.]|nr:glycerol-3-phosphate 1-O-acyltransferase PlsY [Caldithrix sp.]